MKIITKSLITCSYLFSLFLGLDALVIEERPKAVGTFHLNATFSSETTSGIPDVYWKNWEGTAPEDAVVIDKAVSESGTIVPVYLGQVDSQPVILFSHSKKTEPLSMLSSSFRTDNIKVLSSKHQDIFTWVPINATESSFIKEDCLVCGFGKEPDEMFGSPEHNNYFGKTEYDGDIYYGKVVDDRFIMKFAYATRMRKASNFNVLCYKYAVEKRQSTA